ncbi:MAG: membrane protein insertase YidC [Bacteroidales bacterium]|nr:membrane protein insertase YidC [Bacteroidales bacterium]
MDKNSVTGFILIAVILFGFTFYQSKQGRKYDELQAQQDSIALVQRLEQEAARLASDSVTVATVLPDGTIAESAASAPAQAIYKDASLEQAHNADAQQVVLSNSKIDLTLSSFGAQPVSVMVKDYFNYDSTALYIFKEGGCTFSASVYTGEYIRTQDFNFQIAERTDSSVVFRLPFSDGGYIEQSYLLHEDSYLVDNALSFVGMSSIPRNVSSIDLDYSVIIPRMEKGYKNEAQYSKLDFYQEGDKKPVEIGRSRNGSKRINSRVSWFAFQQQFFSAIVRAKDQFASGDFDLSFYSQDDESHNLMACSAKMRADFRPGQDVTIPFEMYFGPNHYKTLKALDQKYEKIIPLGGSLVGWFTKYVIIPMFDFFHRFVANYGIIILLMTLVIKLVVLPFTYKSYASSAKMAALKPEIEKINARYPKQEDAMKKQQATMALYNKAGASPMGGCLPMLLTFPILWAMFRFFPASIELRQQSFLWAHDLSTYDSIVDFGTLVPLIGDHLSLFALLMAFTMWIYSKMTMSGQSASNDPNTQSMQFMSVWMMPIMMFFICNSLSAALSYYYLLSQLISMLEIWIIRKFVIKPEAVLAKVKAAEGKPVKKSKFMQRLEEAQKLQEQQMRQQQKNRR